MNTCTCRPIARLLTMAVCTLVLGKSHAQALPARDTLVLSIQAVEKRFIDSNFQLLAAHYNVDAQKALIEQAKLWDNPVLNTDQVIHANGKFFPYGHNADGSYSGQYFIQVQQLIKTARKRGKLIDLASTNSKISELQLQDLLRNLRYQLHIDYFTLQQQLANRNLLLAQQQQLSPLLNAMQAQFSLGNIAQKELLRIQALLIGLNQDLTDINKTIADSETDLKTLLQLKDESFVKPESATDSSANAQLTYNLQSLQDMAKQNNPNYQLQVAQTLYQQQNLTYQKALRVPDITVGPNFDRNSNFAPNYVGLGISLPLPVFNKNQGNIKAAEFGIKQQQAVTQNAETDLANSVSNAYQKLMLTIAQNSTTQKDFYTKYQGMFQNMLKSYQQKQISLLEFIDFFNDYNDLQQRLNQQQLNLQLSKQELNYNIGTDAIQ
ncbi:TolC family protein [Deminuibacter soli]|uniref:TolC family protein n=1 Tax=Deminuibacter soli TaxID=2291815 RepID=A0A3E1NJP3_9BACT|nr:TolC family protein [Deminuibacter soli]RFM28156.1 TolC family protein [Deminuibacter soli]